MKRSDEKSCVPDTNCCLTSAPCKNGATCVFNPRTSLPEARFSCRCRPGYNGVYCEKPIRSCSGYIDTNNGSGIYQIIDKTTSTSFPVFCTFWPKSRKAWTRIQSYHFSDTKVIEQTSKNGTSVNENFPKNSPYRLTVSKMESIRENSTKWRIAHSKKLCSTHIYVDISGKACSNLCTGSTRVKLNATASSKIKISCNVESGGSSACVNDHRSRVDEYGLFCCVTYPRNCSDFVTTKIWLGDVH